MSLKTKVLIVAGAIVLAFAAGRYSAPGSIKTEAKNEQSEEKKTKEKEETNTERRKITKEITRPDGTKETTVVDEEIVKKKKSDATSEKTKETNVVKTEETRSGSKLTVSALAGAKIKFSGPLEPVYGGMVSKEILGPVSIGAFGLSNGVGGVAVGVSF